MAGIVIHEAIAVEVGHWATGEVASERSAVAQAMTQLDEIWENRTERILEVRNGAEVESSEMELCRGIVRSRLERFFEMIWPRFSDLRHETHEKLEDLRGCALPVVLKIDLAGWNRQGQLVIVDWKTGGIESVVGGRVQLAVYALWAHTTFGLRPTAILPTLASLRTGEVIRFEPTEFDLDFIKATVRADRDQVRKFARAASFPASPQSDKCWGCSSLNECADGRTVVGL